MQVAWPDYKSQALNFDSAQDWCLAETCRRNLVQLRQFIRRHVAKTMQWRWNQSMQIENSSRPSSILHSLLPKQKHMRYVYCTLHISRGVIFCCQKKWNYGSPDSILQHDQYWKWVESNWDKAHSLFPTTAGVTGAESETVINKRSNDVGR